MAVYVTNLIYLYKINKFECAYVILIYTWLHQPTIDR